MRLQTLARTLFNGHWRHMVAAMAATLFLLPVPVYGLTFLGPWRFLQSRVMAPSVVTTSGDNSLGGFLELGMGFNPPTQDPFGLPMAVSSITATRNFRITNPSELLTISQAFQNFLQGANVNVTLQLTRLNVPDPFPAPVSLSSNERAGIRFGGSIAGSTPSPVSLNAGDYNVTVRVKYKKHRLGFWDNTLPELGSPYVLRLTGV